MRQIKMTTRIIKMIQKAGAHIKTPTVSKHLGRWELTYCDDTLERKVGLANEDHCGTCYSIRYTNTDGVQKPIKNHVIDLE